MHSEKAQTILLVGGFSEVIELAEECGRRIVGLIDPHLSGSHLGYPVLGTDDDAAAIGGNHPDVPVFVGLDPPEQRLRLVDLYARAGFRFANLVHPQVRVSRTATVGSGVMVQYGAHLSSNVRLEDHVRVNACANLMHDVTVGRGSTIAPNAVLLGRVRVGARCYIGAQSTILPDVEIGDGAVVGAMANVTKSVAPGTVVVGNPARPLPPRPRS